ncbi:MAG: hypothetical protein WD512_14565, partial [Candidatus Paceibacterota bacterium]
FKDDLEKFIVSANKAIKDTNKKDSCEYWQEHLGNRFSCENVKDEKDYSSLAKGASKSTMWTSI